MRRIICTLTALAMLFWTCAPTRAATTLDPTNPGANFSKDGGQNHTPGSVLTLTDTSGSDFVVFFASDFDANPGIEIDVIATFRVTARAARAYLQAMR